jgi:hypothetical protein
MNSEEILLKKSYGFDDLNDASRDVSEAIENEMDNEEINIEIIIIKKQVNND